MSGPVLIARGAEAASVDAAIAAIRRRERLRQAGGFLALAGGWIFGAAATAICVATILKTPPVPVPRVGIAFVGEDGGPRVDWRENLPPSRQAAVFRASVRAYIAHRERWNWEASKADYDTVSAMSDPDERARYQAAMNDPKDPENPAVRYGAGIGAAKVQVAAVNVRPTNLKANNTVLADMVLRILTPDGKATLVCKSAELNWIPAPDLVPLEVQETDDLAGIAFTFYRADPAPDANCAGAPTR